MSLLGRVALLNHLHALIYESRKSSTARVLRLTAQAGYGKSAVLGSLASALSSDADTLVMQYAARREETTQPGGAIRALLHSQAQQLASKHPEHVSGLEALFSADENLPVERLEVGFGRLVASLADEVPVVIIVDDWQWIDEESARALRSMLARLAERSVVVCLAQRSRTPIFSWGRIDTRDVVVAPLDLESSVELVRLHFAHATDALAAEIAKCARGIPLDLIVLARHAALSDVSHEEDLTKSFNEAIRHDLATLAPTTREILLTCTLLREPIAYRTLNSIWNDTELTTALEILVPRFLDQTRSGLSFVHTRIRQAVESLLMPAAPLQRRALVAISGLQNPSMQELRDAAELAATLGDRSAQHEVGMRLGTYAAKQGDLAISADAFRSAFSVEDPTDPGGIEACLPFVGVLRLLERNEEAKAFLEARIGRLSPSFQPPGSGALVAALANILFGIGMADSAMSVSRRFEKLLRDPMERVEVESVRLMFELLLGDDTILESQRYNELIDLGIPRVSWRLLNGRATFAVPRGDRRTVLHDLASLAAYQADVPQIFVHFAADTNEAWQWHDRGVPAVRNILLDRVSYGQSSLSYQLGLLTLADLVAGSWELALERIAEIGIERFSEFDRDHVLVHCAAIVAIFGANSATRETVEKRTQQLLRERPNDESAEIAVWYGASASSQRFTTCEIDYVAQWMLKPRPPARWTSWLSDFAIAMFADRYAQTKAVAAAPTAAPKSHWMQACEDLRVGWVTQDSELLRRAARGLETLGALALKRIALARIEAAAGGRRTVHQHLDDLLTPREREVCALVSEGLTNRSIAQRLFVSERTVATHVSNALGKVGARTRTELVRKMSAADAEEALGP